MDLSSKLFTTFINPVTMIMALVLIVSILHRKERAPLQHTLFIGSVFSGALFLSMSDPIDLGSAGIHDMRGLLIGTATALLNPIVGLMTLATGLVLRWHIGGPGMIPGFVAMFGAYGGGLLWRLFVADRSFAAWKKSILMGALITLHLVGIFFFPVGMWGGLLMTLSPYYLLANVLGSLLINFLMGGELSFLSEAESLKMEANTDHLTGLLNRRGLDLIVPDLKEPKGVNKGRALLFFDIDKFKDTNDTFGHSIGDSVLKQVTDCVSEKLRKHDVFARVGGDEFAIILPEVDVIEAKMIADRCRMVVDEHSFMFDGQTVPITISLGAVWLHDPSTLEVMMNAADEALYQAKSNGRNAVVFLSSLRQGQSALMAQEYGPQVDAVA